MALQNFCLAFFECLGYAEGKAQDLSGPSPYSLLNDYLKLRYSFQEIDFLAKKKGKEYLVQAAYSVVEEKTYDREFALFNVVDQSRKKILITNDDIDFSTSTVEHISLSKFLMMNDLDS